MSIIRPEQYMPGFAGGDSRKSQNVTVKSLSGNTIVLSGAINLSCPGCKQEIRRNAPGLAEYGATITGKTSPTTFRISYEAVPSGKRTPLKIGETVYVYCADCGGGGGGGGLDIGGDDGISIGAGGGAGGGCFQIPIWAVVAAVALVAFAVMD